MSAPVAIRIVPIAPAAEGFAALDRAVGDLRAGARAWAKASISTRIDLLTELMGDVHAVGLRWAQEAARAQGMPLTDPPAAEPGLLGPYLTLRFLRLLRRSLAGMEEVGAPPIPGGVRRASTGQAVARVMPTDWWDWPTYPFVRAEVWMQPGLAPEEIAGTQAVAYRRADAGGVALVLGAGNVSSIGPLDALGKLFVENRAVVLKLHPVLAWQAPILERAFGALIRRGVLRVVNGDAAAGEYLCRHPGVDEVHVTGSSATYSHIAQSALGKRITAELGCITPVIVVPGRWSTGGLRHHAQNVAQMLTNNAGFNCAAARVVVTARQWNQRDAFLEALREALRSIPTPVAYYPGAERAWSAFVADHPGADQLGARQEERGGVRLPWILAAGLNADDPTEPAFSREPFCSVFSETALDGDDAAAFLKRAVTFCNHRLWGSLDATLIVPWARSLDSSAPAAVDRAVASLRYGAIAINQWSGVSFGLGVTTWGAFPGEDQGDPGSGIGVVHNALMFSKAQKSVVRAPFRPWPKPVWFPGHRHAGSLTRKLLDFEAAPSIGRLLRLAPEAALG